MQHNGETIQESPKISLDVIFMKNTKHLFKIMLVLAVVATVIFTFACCGKQEAPEQTTQATTEETTLPEEPEVYVNRLTGLDDLSEDAIGKRPIAVMINNIKKALPQYGIGSADLMFEMLTEGGITRMMAVYADQTKIPNVCTVRSCRYYYPIFAHGLDAVYFCFGSNETIGTPTLKRIGIDYLDGNQLGDSLIYARDPERLKKYGSEHTVYLKGQNMSQILEKYDIRSEYKEEKDTPIFLFNKEGELTKGDVACDKVNLAFSNAYYSTFNYDKETKTYKKLHSGNAHIDSATGEQLAYKNIFVLETDVSQYKDTILVQIDWKGGTGYYISNGTSQKITWEKPAEDSTIKVYDADGEELKVNPGNSYIGVINEGRTTITAVEK